MFPVGPVFVDIAGVREVNWVPQEMPNMYIIRLVFIAEWAAFLLFELLRGELRSGPEILAAAWPLAFFYLVGWLLETASRRREHLASRPVLLVAAAILLGLDQALKALAENRLAEGQDVSLIPGLLELTHVLNRQGSWVANVAEVEPSPLLIAGLALFCAVLLPVVFLYHAHFAQDKQNSFWIDLAFLGLLAGLASALVDLLLRGGALDYIGLPDVIAADGKDLYLWLAVSSVLVDVLIHPERYQRESGAARIK